jgi:hypothetical protein
VDANDVLLWLLVAVVAFLLGQSRGAIPGAVRHAELPSSSYAARDDDRLLAYRAWVQGQLERWFTVDDLRNISMELGMPWESFGGVEEGLVPAMLEYCERRRMIGRLLDELKLKRG